MFFRRKSTESPKAHRAGEPSTERCVGSSPFVDLIGNGRVRFRDDFSEDVWPEIGFRVTIPSGHVSDGYSIPRLAWLIAGHPFGQTHMTPAFVHDYLCDVAAKYEDRVLADAVFFNLMHKYGVPRWKQTTFYICVRFWGRYMWRVQSLWSSWRKSK